jgi:hypothetical protein
MNREDVIRIALEVGFYDDEVNKCQLMLERFAYLVAQQEREKCAKVADIAIDFWVKAGYPEGAEANEAMNIANAIRARGQA